MLKKDDKFIDPLSFSAFERPTVQANLMFLLMCLFLVAVLIWISVSKIDEIVKGHAGKVIPSLGIQSIQSVDGGTIQKILVKEGSIVKKGQELMVIDDLRFNSSVDEVKNELYGLKLKRIRLSTQNKIDNLKRVPKLQFPENIDKDIPLSYFKVEENHYKDKVNELRGALRVENTRYKQKVQENSEIAREIVKLKQSKKNIEERLKLIKQGVSDGVISKIEQLQLQEGYDNTLGELDIAKLAYKRSKIAIDESTQNMKQLFNSFRVDSSKELSDVETQIRKLEAKLTFSNDRVEKSIIYAPTDGIVNKLYYTTIGGVVKAADIIMDIVPTDDTLLVEVKIEPKDIGFVGANNSVTVKITAYDFTIFGGLKGKIEQIGADTIYDDETKKSYYQLLVRTDKNYLGSKDNKLVIIPGMVADIDIKTGKKTILEYLMKPITKTVSNSLIER